MVKEIWTNFKSFEKFGEEIRKILEIPDDYVLLAVKFRKPYLMLLFNKKVYIIHFKTFEIITELDLPDISPFNNFYYYSLRIEISDEFDFSLGIYLFVYDLNTKKYKVYNLSELGYSMYAQYVTIDNENKRIFIAESGYYGPLLIYDKKTDSFTFFQNITGPYIYALYYEKQLNKLYFQLEMNVIRELDLINYSYRDYAVENFITNFYILTNPVRFVYVDDGENIRELNTETMEEKILLNVYDYVKKPYRYIFYLPDNDLKTFFIFYRYYYDERRMRLFKYDYEKNILESITLIDDVITFRTHEKGRYLSFLSPGYTSNHYHILDTYKKRIVFSILTDSHVFDMLDIIQTI